MLLVRYVSDVDIFRV